MTERIGDKAKRLLVSSAVMVVSASTDEILAHVRGDTDLYTVEWNRGHWACSCPCYSTCSHVTAVSMVTVRPVLRLVGAYSGDES